MVDDHGSGGLGYGRRCIAGTIIDDDNGAARHDRAYDTLDSWRFVPGWDHDGHLQDGYLR